MFLIILLKFYNVCFYIVLFFLFYRLIGGDLVFGVGLVVVVVFNVIIVVVVVVLVVFYVINKFGFRKKV